MTNSFENDLTLLPHELFKINGSNSGTISDRYIDFSGFDGCHVPVSGLYQIEANVTVRESANFTASLRLQHSETVGEILASQVAYNLTTIVISQTLKLNSETKIKMFIKGKVRDPVCTLYFKLIEPIHSNSYKFLMED
jgi:hypothetical protein